MKTHWSQKSFLSLGLAFVSALAVANAQEGGPVPDGYVREELPVRVFIPRLGYDDNDPVQAVVDVTLPNRCYTLSDFVKSKDETTGVITLKQMALRQVDGFCAENTIMPSSYRVVSSYKHEVSLGQMHQGAHVLRYASARDPETHALVRSNRPFTVSAAEFKNDVDDFKYAPVENIQAKGAFEPGDEVSVVLTGVLTSGCMKLEKKVSVERVDDIIVLKPTVTIDEGGLCHFLLTPFETEPVRLGKFEPGRYLIHSRSMGGSAVNVLFTQKE